jgi:hypothetical protein
MVLIQLLLPSVVLVVVLVDKLLQARQELLELQIKVTAAALLLPILVVELTVLVVLVVVQVLSVETLAVMVE